VYGLLLAVFTRIYGGGHIDNLKRGDLFASNALAALFANGITYLETCLVARGLVILRPFVLMTAVQLVLLWVWSTVFSVIYRRVFPPRQLLVVYGRRESMESLMVKMRTRSEKYEVEGVINVAEGVARVERKIAGSQAVLLCDIHAGDRNLLLKYCFQHKIRVYLTPSISDTMVRGAKPIHLFDSPLLLCKNEGLTPEQRFAKRAADLVLCAVACIPGLPLMAIVAAAVYLQDRGPVLFRQDRLTRDGRVFTLYKFRSMVVDAERDGARLAKEDDDRITPVGRVIRRLRLDELPQLLNILRGDMSFVGPRPERPEIARVYETYMPEFSFRLRVKAGLTGYAQVLGKYNTTPYDKLRLDLMYIANYSFFEDVKLVLMTIKTLFQRESTEGVEGRLAMDPTPEDAAPPKSDSDPA